MSTVESACRSELVKQMAGFVTRLHSFPIATARACGLRETDPRQYLPDLMRRANNHIAHRLDAEVWRYYKRLFELYLNSLELHTYTPSLLHGDLSPWHFLGDLKGCVLTGVIDFGDSFIGDPHGDLIFILEDYGKDILDLFLTFYAPDTRQRATRRVQMFQQLDNVEYCLSKLSEGDSSAVEEALRTLVIQANLKR